MYKKCRNKVRIYTANRTVQVYTQFSDKFYVSSNLHHGRCQTIYIYLRALSQYSAGRVDAESHSALLDNNEEGDCLEKNIKLIFFYLESRL